MSYCSKCGSQASSGAFFCSSCGEPMVILEQDRQPRLADMYVPQASGATGAPASPTREPKIDNTFAIVLAVLPLSYLFTDKLISDSVSTAGQFTGWSVATVLALNCLFIRLDYSTVRRTTGRGTPWGWGLLLVPLYLGLRTPGRRGSAVFVLVWCACFLVYFVAPPI
jgi:hypothetical protein